MQSYRHRYATSEKPHAGDFVVYLKDGKPYHIGIVEAVNSDGTFTTIEGNTSATGSNVEPNGGAVARKTRRVKNVVFLCN
jgi:surface antigen